MWYTEFRQKAENKRYRTIQAVFPLDQLILTKRFAAGNDHTLAKDPRSFVDQAGMWHVFPVGVRKKPSGATEDEVSIVCPFCGDIHTHGLPNDGSDPGCRISHCHGVVSEVKSYYIHRPQEAAGEEG